MLDVHKLTDKKYNSTVIWAVGISLFIVAFTSVLARAALNLQAAIIDKPNLAVHTLLEDYAIRDVQLMDDLDLERRYLVETDDGMKFVTLQKKNGKWELKSMEHLHGNNDEN